MLTKLQSASYYHQASASQNDVNNKILPPKIDLLLVSILNNYWSNYSYNMYTNFKLAHFKQLPLNEHYILYGSTFGKFFAPPPPRYRSAHAWTQVQSVILVCLQQLSLGGIFSGCTASL